MFGKLRGSLVARKTQQKDTSAGKKSFSLKSFFSKKHKSKKEASLLFVRVTKIATDESSDPVESTQVAEIGEKIQASVNMGATVVEALQGVDGTLNHPSILNVRQHAGYSPYPAFVSPVSSPIAVEPSSIIDDTSALRQITTTIKISEINAREGSSIDDITTYDPVHNPREATELPASPSNNLPHLPKGNFRVKMSPDDMKVVRPLWKAATGVIYLARDTITGTRIAIKVVEQKGKNDYGISSFIQEVHIMQKIAPYNFFVDLYGSWSDSRNFYIGMATYPTDLNAELMRLEKLEPARARFYMAEIIIALTTLHKCGIIHRDIKAANILIDWEGHIALCDFSLSKDFQRLPTIPERVYQPYWPYHRYANPTSHTEENDPRELDFVAWDYRGSELEMAPEIHLRQPYSFGVDFWSAAVVLYRMLTGRHPWFDIENCVDPDLVVGGVKPLAMRIAEDDLVFKAEDNVDDTTQDFLQKMLTKNPKSRLLIDYEMPNHPYFAGVNWSLLEARKSHPPWRPTYDACHFYEESGPDLTYYTEDVDENPCPSINCDDAALRYPTPSEYDDKSASGMEYDSYNHPAAPRTSTESTMDATPLGGPLTSCESYQELHSHKGDSLTLSDSDGAQHDSITTMPSASSESATTLINPSSSAKATRFACSPSTLYKSDRKLNYSYQSSPRPTTTNRGLLSKAKSWWMSKTWTPKAKGARIRLKNLFRTTK